MTDGPFWIRRHSNGFQGYVQRFHDGTFAATARRPSELSGVAYERGIGSLGEAKVIADKGVQVKAPHSCEAEKCESWPDDPSEA